MFFVTHKSWMFKQQWRSYGTAFETLGAAIENMAQMNKQIAEDYEGAEPNQYLIVESVGGKVVIDENGQVMP